MIQILEFSNCYADYPPNKNSVDPITLSHYFNKLS